LKYAYTTIAKESRDVTTIDLLGFFLQTKRDKEELLMLKLTRASLLLLVKIDREK